MNLNKVAKEVAKLEGKKKQTDIAQIKEIMACVAAAFLSIEYGDDFDEAMERFWKSGRSKLNKLSKAKKK